MGLPRSVAWYRLKGRDDADLRHRLKVLADRYPHYGYLTLHEMLKQEGRVINRKRTYRVYREEGLQVRTKRRKKITRPGVHFQGPVLLGPANRCEAALYPARKANSECVRGELQWQV